jgi:hypothetical protein
LVEDLKIMLDEFNPLCKSFRKIRDLVEHGSPPKMALRLFRKREKDTRMHSLPTVDEVAGLIIGDYYESEEGRDIIIDDVSRGLRRIHETHPLYMPLQYPLVFPRGDYGYEEDIPYREFEDEEKKSRGSRERVAIREYIAFRIQERDCEFGNIVLARRLMQQFSVDCYTMIEAQRLSYIRNNQGNIRSDLLSGIQEAVELGDNDPRKAGQRVILPDSFTGSPRYMFNNCQDAMAICKRFGYPDLFITITCNSNWNEIKNFVSARGLSASDRHDIICRVFKMKLDQMMADFKKDKIFGPVIAGIYTYYRVHCCFCCFK